MARTSQDTAGPPVTRTRQNGAAIRALREKDGWTQDGLASASGINQAYLSLIESETRDAPVTTINRIARALRVPVAAIMRELDEPSRAEPSGAVA
jgi:transcriptional regulator with XRE-family HTH domain